MMLDWVCFEQGDWEFVWWGCRLIDVVLYYYDLSNFLQCEVRCVLERLYMKCEREKFEVNGGKRQLGFLGLVFCVFVKCC